MWGEGKEHEDCWSEWISGVTAVRAVERDVGSCHPCGLIGGAVGIRDGSMGLGPWAEGNAAFDGHGLHGVLLRLPPQIPDTGKEHNASDALVLVDGRLCALGGSCEELGESGWVDLPSLGERHSFGVAVGEGDIVVMGGNDGKERCPQLMCCAVFVHRMVQVEW